MQVIKMGSATFKLSETSGTLAKLQKCIDGQKRKTKRPAIKSDGKRYYPDISKCKNTADYVRQFYMLNDFKIDPAELFEPMRDAPIQFPLGIDGIEEIDDTEPDQFAADAVADVVASAHAAAAICQAMAPAVADARELETVGADCGPVEASTASDVIGPLGHAQSGHGGPAGHAGEPDFGVRGMGPDPVFGVRLAVLDPEPVGISEPSAGVLPEHVDAKFIGARVKIKAVTHAGIATHDAMVGQVGRIAKAFKGRNMYRIAFENGQSWESYPRNLDILQNVAPADVARAFAAVLPEPAEPMEISAPLVDDSEPAGIPRNRETHSDSDYHDWIRGSISNFAYARRVPYREAADIAELHWPRMRAEFLAGASVHDMCRILGEINPEPPEPMGILEIVADAIQKDYDGTTRESAIRIAQRYCDMTAPLDYSPWRHGGWYVANVRYPSGATGCVSRNYPDKKWRIVCGRPDDETYPSRDAAARAEQAIALAQYLPAAPIEPEPVAIADGGPVVFNADRREWVHAGTIEPEPVENGETAPAGTFKESGTGVNSVLLAITAPY